MSVFRLDPSDAPTLFPLGETRSLAPHAIHLRQDEMRCLRQQALTSRLSSPAVMPRRKLRSGASTLMRSSDGFHIETAASDTLPTIYLLSRSCLFQISCSRQRTAGIGSNSNQLVE